MFRDALLAALQAFCAGSCSDQTQAAWERALATIVTAMTAGSAATQPGGDGAPGEGTNSGTGPATGGAAGEPAWWLAEAAATQLLPGAEDIVNSGQAAMMARAAALVSAAAPTARLHADPCPVPSGRYDRPRETGCTGG